jgi:hypothetical protein
MILSEKNRFEFTPDHVFKAKLSKKSASGQLVQIKNILKEIKQRVSA